MIEKYEQAVDKWLKTMEWKENPFTLKIDPSLFVGYGEQLNKLTRHVREGHKIALLTGPTGSGKTTLLLLLKSEFSREYDVIYLPKPPKMDELVGIFTSFYKPSLLARMFGMNGVHVHNLADHVNKKCKRKLLLMIDEIHESDIEVLEWLRTLDDHINNMQLIISGLPITDGILRKNLETLRNRITSKVELTSLDESETSEFIKKRIESVGGKGLAPLGEDLVRQIYKKTGGFPREILKLCDMAVEKNMLGEKMRVEDYEIETSENENAREQSPIASSVTGELSRDFIRDLPAKQRRILEILSKHENMYPSEVAASLGTEKYKTKQHAVRSMNNILQRLMDEGFVHRKERGKGYVYILEPKVRSLLTEA